MKKRNFWTIWKIVACRLATEVNITNNVLRPTPESGRPEKAIALTWKIAPDSLKQTFMPLSWIKNAPFYNLFTLQILPWTSIMNFWLVYVRPSKYFVTVTTPLIADYFKCHVFRECHFLRSRRNVNSSRKMVPLCLALAHVEWSWNLLGCMERVKCGFFESLNVFENQNFWQLQRRH